jgi:hypothetical protein
MKTKCDKNRYNNTHCWHVMDMMNECTLREHGDHVPPEDREDRDGGVHVYMMRCCWCGADKRERVE